MFACWNCWTMRHRDLVRSVLVLSAVLLAGCGVSGNNTGGSAAPTIFAAGTRGAEASVGERLFVETRFAQFFKSYLDSGGGVNDTLPVGGGDEVMDFAETTGPRVGFQGFFRGLSMNCRACHLVDEHVDPLGRNMRTYTDFAVRSPIPDRGDGKRTAPRNSPPLVNASLSRPGGELFHFDGEFSTLEDLIAGTFTGRNFGWLPGQKLEAIRHIARVMREDDGSGVIAQQFDGLPYPALFTGNNPAIPDELRLPPQFRIFISSTNDDQKIFDAVVKVVAAYVRQLQFSQSDEVGNPVRSPFDVFLQRNGLPQGPDNNETNLAYSRRLRTLINAPGFAPRFVTSNPNRAGGQFKFHAQAFVFGATELEGLKMFLAEPAALPASPGELAAGKIGNCLACHAAPNFTDFKLHNTGTTQKEYDDPQVHGPGAFSALSIPTLATRTANDLPASEQHPGASERFRSIPSNGTTLTDLGVWNVFANPDMPGPQDKIRAILCDDQIPCPVADAALLDRAIARFKTPGLRDLSHSAPYMHNGQFPTLDSIIGFYRGTSDQARALTLRNGAMQLQGIALIAGDEVPLVAFLKSLNEDYQ